MALVDGTYKHGQTIGLLKLNVYGSPSGTYCYVDGLLEFLKSRQAQVKEAEARLVKIKVPTGELIVAIAVEYFLTTA